MWLTDPKTKKKSVTLTILIITTILCSLKLLVSGLTVSGVGFSQFSGGDFAAAVGAAGAIYFGRKYTDTNGNEKENETK